VIANFMIRARGANDGHHDPRRWAARSIESSPRGTSWVKVYAGFDPVSGQAALPRRGGADAAGCGGGGGEGPDALHEVNEHHNAKTRAAVNQLLDRHLETLDVEPTSPTRCEGIIRRTDGDSAAFRPEPRFRGRKDRSNYHAR
jgi:hypothetical protein